MTVDPALALVVQVAAAGTRHAAAAALAAHCGATHLLVFVRDDEVGALVPAPDFPRTLPGGPAWKALLSPPKPAGLQRATLPFPDAATLVEVVGSVMADETMFLFMGGQPKIDADAIEGVRPGLTLLAATLRAEHAAKVALRSLTAARATAREAAILTAALDTARAELQRTLAESDRLNNELKEAQRVRETFLGVLGHDLRNPLSAIVLTAQTFMHKGPPDAYAKPMARVARSAARMRRMIDDILDFTRSRVGGGFSITTQPIDDVRVLVGNVIEELHATFPARHVDLRAQGENKVRWDLDRMAQVMSNLVGNALQYSPSESSVKVTIEGGSDRLTIDVHNSGDPIAPASLPHLFDPFRRSGNGEAAKPSGLGLGLYIADQIVKSHGGTIAVSSSIEDGTTFSVRVPRWVDTTGGEQATPPP